MPHLQNDSTNSLNKVALYSANSSLQTGLLAKLIGDELDLDCSVFRTFDEIDDDCTLILIDCNGQEIEPLIEASQKVHLHKNKANAALLNAEYESEHENLLDWPCISGLFYVDTDQAQLIRGLGRLLEGDYWVPRRLLHHFLDRNRKTPSVNTDIEVKLTKREKQILRLINDGATNADIAISLKVSEHTVKSHLYNTYKKIGVRNRLEASNWVRNVQDSLTL
ncbi:MAG: DNA-binding NarL/FixJ family response regulator [Flavobacteriales bacterium]